MAKRKKPAALRQAKREIDEMLAPFGQDCSVCFGKKEITLYHSYQVRSRKARLNICRRIVDTGVTARTPESLSAEWLFHNLAYDLHFMRASARHADLDYTQDTRRAVRLATRFLELFHLY